MVGGVRGRGGLASVGLIFNELRGQFNFEIMLAKVLDQAICILRKVILDFFLQFRLIILIAPRSNNLHKDQKSTIIFIKFNGHSSFEEISCQS